MEHFSGMHNWYACSHARPTFCNVCREALPGVTSHGLSCEGESAVAADPHPHPPTPHQHPLSPPVCKFKAHKRCAVRSSNNCKWTTLASIGSDIVEDEEGVSRREVGGVGGGVRAGSGDASVFPAGVDAPPVAGGKPARQRQVPGVRQELRQRAAAAGLALPLVQSHRE